MKRIALAIGLALLLALVLGVPALAGGWAVITLDHLPGQVVAGEPFEVGFMVRQHGVTPMKGLTPVVHIQGPELGKSLTFTAEEKGETGHYVAVLTLPDSGEWEWSIEAFTGNQPMPALTVLPASAAVEQPVEVEVAASVPTQWPQALAAVLGAAGILAGLVIVLRQKARWAIALILAGIIVSAGSIVSAAGQPKAESEPSAQEAAGVPSADTSLSQVDVGRDLFIAKGCVVCHSHAETNRVREFGVDMGPNLTDFTASQEYLRLWLKEPKAAKSTAQMPTLELSEAEIEALIAFINAE